MSDVTLAELGNLADQMNSIMGLDPAIDTSLDEEKLLEFITLNAEGDEGLDASDNIDKHGKATLRKLKIGPQEWLDEPEKEEKKVSAKKKTTKKKAAKAAPANKAEKAAPENKAAKEPDPAKKKAAPKKAKAEKKTVKKATSKKTVAKKKTSPKKTVAKKVSAPVKKKGITIKEYAAAKIKKSPNIDNEKLAKEIRDKFGSVTPAAHIAIYKSRVKKGLI